MKVQEIAKRRNLLQRGRVAGGFTILEMLMVVAIITVLFGMGMAGFDRMKRQARSHQCVGKLRSLGTALNLYLGENNLMMPKLAAAVDEKKDSSYYEKNKDELPPLDIVLLKYVNSEEDFRCPADHQRLWEQTGCSYFWNSLVNGQSIGNMNFMGLTKNEAGIPIISDKENFHKSVGDEVNILYADGHVVSELQFTVDP